MTSAADRFDPFAGQAFEMMVSDIQSDIESDLKAAAVRLFAKRCSLDLKPVVDKLLAKGLLTMDVISQLMSLQQPSATGVAVPGSTGLRAASTFKSTPASEGGLLPSSRHPVDPLPSSGGSRPS